MKSDLWVGPSHGDDVIRQRHQDGLSRHRRRRQSRSPVLIHVDEVTGILSEYVVVCPTRTTEGRIPRTVGVDDPPGHEPIGAISRIDGVVHLTVEVSVIIADIDSEPIDVDVSVAAHQRIESPRDDGDALLHRPGALVLLDSHADAAVAHPFHHGRHVAVQVDTSWHQGVSCRESERCAHDLIGVLIRHDAAVATTVDEGTQQVGCHLGALCRPYLVKDRPRLGQGARLVCNVDTQSHSRNGIGIDPSAQVRRPGMGHHGPVTTNLLDHARRRQGDLIEGVRTLVEVESPSADLSACQQVATATAELMDSWLGTPARVLDHNGRPVVRWGADEPRALLLGHIDTVWPVGTLERIPWQIEGDRMRGPGVFDMKVGVVQAIAAIALLGLGPDDGVGIVLTTDEEIGSGTSRTLIEDAARHADAVLVLEPSVTGHLKTARKGTSWYVVEITGRASHAGLDPERGINALVEAADLVRVAVTWADPAVGTTVTPTTARAGVTDNTVPDTAIIGIDVRAWSADEQQRIDNLMRGWKPSHPEAGVRIINGGINRPAMEESAGSGLAQLAEVCAVQLGIAPIGSRAVGGASDGNFTAALGIPTLDGLGAVGDGAHAEHEWASVMAMPERTALIAALLSAILAGGLA